MSKTKQETMLDVKMFDDFIFVSKHVPREIPTTLADFDDFWDWVNDLELSLIDHAIEKGAPNDLMESYADAADMGDTYFMEMAKSHAQGFVDYHAIHEDGKKILLKYFEFAGEIVDPNYTDVDPRQKYGSPDADIFELLQKYIEKEFKSFEELSEEEFFTPSEPIPEPFTVAIGELEKEGFFDTYGVIRSDKVRKLFDGKPLNKKTFLDVYTRVYDAIASGEDTKLKFTNREGDRVHEAVWDNPYAIHVKNSRDYRDWIYKFDPNVDQVAHAIQKKLRNIVVIVDPQNPQGAGLHFYDDSRGIYVPLDHSRLAILARSYFPKMSASDIERLRVKMTNGGTFKRVTKERSPYLAPFKNGVFNAKKGILEKHSPERVFTSTHYVDYAWHEEQPENGFKVDDFIKQMSGGDPLREAYIWRMIGETMFPNYQSKKIWYLVGDGSDGKSTLLEIIGVILGTRWMAANLEDMSDKKRDQFLTGAIYESEAVAILGDENNVTSKLEGMTLVKSLSRGNLFKVRRMKEVAFKAKMNLTLIQAGNGLPQIEGLDKALADRFFFIKTFNLFESNTLNHSGFIKLEDAELIDALDIEKNPSLYRYLASEAARRFQVNNYLPELEDDEKYHQEWIGSESIEVTFINQYFLDAPKGRYPRPLVVDMYKMFCQENDEQPKTGQAFLNAMEKAVPMSKLKNKLLVKPSNSAHKFESRKMDEFFEELKELDKLTPDFDRKPMLYMEKV